MSRALQFTQLSPARQASVRLCKSATYGSAHDLVVRDREPILTSLPRRVPVDVKLDSEDWPSQEVPDTDFLVCAELSRLTVLLDPDPPPRDGPAQLKLWLVTVWTWEEVFGRTRPDPFPKRSATEVNTVKRMNNELKGLNMAQDTKFKSGRSGNPATQFKPGNPHRWGPGVSGNASGKSKYRTQFEDAFNEALITQGSPQEAAQLLWEAARSKEPWAIQNICQRFAPQTQSLRLTHEVNDDGIDYSKLTDEQLEKLDAMLEQAGLQSTTPEGGEGTPPAA